MLTFEELYAQNDCITELSNVLTKLLEDRFLCDSKITAELFFRYVDEVKKHLEIVDRKLYTQLLTSGDHEIKTTVNRFMGGSKEIKRLFAEFIKKWCHMKKQELRVKDYEEFSQAAQEMFTMVLDRIQDETEHLYPLLKKVRGDTRTAA